MTHTHDPAGHRPTDPTIDGRGPARRTLDRRTFVGTLLAGAATALAACGGDDGDDTAAPTTTARTSASSTTVAPTTTSTTVEVDPVGGKPAVDAGATTTTVPGPPVYPLTGLPLPDPAFAAHSALVVKIDNAPGARPQTGFNSADIVFEEIVNDNLTRFAMVFHSQGSDPVGPIRSGRIQDIDLFGAFQHPLFAWSGGNATVTAAIRASDLVDIGPSRAAVYFRSSDRKAPHNLYSNTTDLWTQQPPDWRPPVQQFAYRGDGDSLQGTPSAGLEAKLDAVDVRWLWDAASGTYLRWMEGDPHQDRASGQINAQNVVVLVMDYLPGISGSPDAQTLGQNEAFVFTGGNVVHGIWTRADRLQPFALVADDGKTIRLTPGRTWVELPRVGTTTPLGPA